MTQLFLARHGQTVGNVQRVWQGWTEGELTSLGIQQAEATARHLVDSGEAFDALYSSPLRRSWQTAEIVGRMLGQSLVAHDGLREIWFGEVEGLTFEEFAARYPEEHRRWSNKSDMSYTWPGGESRAEFHRRTQRAIAEIASWHKDKSIVVVAHGGSLRAILAYLFPAQLGQWWTCSLGNCSLTQARLVPDAAQLLALNDQSHLEGLISDDTWTLAAASSTWAVQK